MASIGATQYNETGRKVSTATKPVLKADAKIEKQIEENCFDAKGYLKKDEFSKVMGADKTPENKRTKDGDTYKKAHERHLLRHFVKKAESSIPAKINYGNVRYELSQGAGGDDLGRIPAKEKGKFERMMDTLYADGANVGKSLGDGIRDLKDMRKEVEKGSELYETIVELERIAVESTEIDKLSDKLHNDKTLTETQVKELNKELRALRESVKDSKKVLADIIDQKNPVVDHYLRTLATVQEGVVSTSHGEMLGKYVGETRDEALQTFAKGCKELFRGSAPTGVIDVTTPHGRQLLDEDMKKDVIVTNHAPKTLAIIDELYADVSSQSRYVLNGSKPRYAS